MIYRRQRHSSRRHVRPTWNHRHSSSPLSLLVGLFLPALTVADEQPTSTSTQTSAPFVDQITGLPMERFFGARTQFGLGLTLPDSATPSASFIGQFTFPLKAGAGWGAMGLIGEMEGNFILAVWPDGAGGVMASFRQATNEDNPPEVTGKFAVRPIADGVSVNNTFLTYTFLCENCLDAGLGLGPEATDANAVMGWALSERAIRNPSNAGAPLGFHEKGFGPFTARLGNAKVAQAQFDAVVAKAGAPVKASAKAIAATPGAAGNGGGDDAGDDGGDDGGDSGDESGGEDDD